MLRQDEWRTKLKPASVIDVRNRRKKWQVAYIISGCKETPFIVVKYHGKSIRECEIVNRYVLFGGKNVSGKILCLFFLFLKNLGTQNEWQNMGHSQM